MNHLFFIIILFDLFLFARIIWWRRRRR